MPPRTNPIEFQIVRAALAGDFALANSLCTKHGGELLRIAKSNKLLENKPQLAEQAIALLLRQRCDRPAFTSKLFLLCQPFGAATLDVPLLEESTRVTGQSRVIQTASLSHSDVSLNKAAEPVLARCAADMYVLTSNNLLTDPNVVRVMLLLPALQRLVAGAGHCHELLCACWPSCTTARAADRLRLPRYCLCRATSI
jgi:hypothetical protein